MLIALSGCLPEKRVHWAPSGKVAAVIGADGLYLCDEQGALTDRLLPGARRVTWQLDGRVLYVVHSEHAKTWDEAAQRLRDNQRTRIIDAAAKLRARLLAHTGKLEELPPDATEELTGGESAAALLYLRSQQDPELAAKYADQWRALDAFKCEYFELSRIELAGQNVRKLEPVYRCFDDMIEPRLNPGGNWIAWVTARKGRDNATRLLAMPLRSLEDPIEVIDYVSFSFDWTVDGRGLIFAATRGWFSSDEEEIRVGVLAQRVVRDDEGAYMENLPEPEDLAGILFHREVRVRTLPDQRILIACRAAKLPAEKSAMPPRMGLFVFDATAAEKLRPVIADEQMLGPNFAESLCFFEPSPNGQYVAVAAGDQSIGVVTVATGDWWSLQKYGMTAGDMRSRPSWKGLDELCFVSAPPPNQGDGKAAVVVAKLDFAAKKIERRVVSETWPKAVIAGFLIPEEEPASQPATRPAAPASAPATQPVGSR